MTKFGLKILDGLGHLHEVEEFVKLRVGREIEDSKLLKKRKSLELNLVCHSGTNLFKKIEDLNRELSPFNRRLDFSFFWRDFEAAIAEQLEYPYSSGYPGNELNFLTNSFIISSFSSQSSNVPSSPSDLLFNSQKDACSINMLI